MIGRAIGLGFSTARDFVARGLIRLRVAPNTLTLVGMVVTTVAGVCYALGSGSRFDPGDPSNGNLLLAGCLLILASACDMLDGAVARLSDRKSRFGAFLDSTLDRYSDFAVFAGVAIHYAMVQPANVTFVLLSMMGFFNAFMVSYAKARAEDLIPECKVGFWQRGERSTAILVASFSGNIPALVLQQAILPCLTVLRRVLYTRAVINGKRPITDPRLGGWWLKVRLWRWPRGTVPYDLVCVLLIAFLILAPVPAWDAIREWAMP
jgi:CDP-diacylglycerol--glycerol-3-phosphate 3-phosphatidyltransferase